LRVQICWQSRERGPSFARTTARVSGCCGHIARVAWPGGTVLLPAEDRSLPRV